MGVQLCCNGMARLSRGLSACANLCKGRSR